MDDFFHHMTQTSLIEFFYRNVEQTVTRRVQQTRSQIVNDIKGNIWQSFKKISDQHTKTRKTWKNVSRDDFSFEDLGFLSREFQMDNMRMYWGCLEPNKTEFDEIKIWNSVVSAFRQLSANGQATLPISPAYVHELDAYITLDSLKQNYHKICKINRNDSYILRLYHLFSNRKMMKRIYLPQFLAVVHPLIYGNYVEKNYVAFRLYDGDDDGVITSLDLTDLIKNLLDRCPNGGVGKFQTKQCKCVLYEEVENLN